jgi:heterodisulfide reductase subunit A
MQPLKEAELEVNQTALVIGGGISGMALPAAWPCRAMKPTSWKSVGQLGGQARNLYKTISGDRWRKLAAGR